MHTYIGVTELNHSWLFRIAYATTIIITTYTIMVFWTLKIASLLITEDKAYSKTYLDGSGTHAMLPEVLHALVCLKTNMQTW